MYYFIYFTFASVRFFCKFLLLTCRDTGRVICLSHRSVPKVEGISECVCSQRVSQSPLAGLRAFSSL